MLYLAQGAMGDGIDQLILPVLGFLIFLFIAGVLALRAIRFESIESPQPEHAATPPGQIEYATPRPVTRSRIVVARWFWRTLLSLIAFYILVVVTYELYFSWTTRIRTTSFVLVDSRTGLKIEVEPKDITPAVSGPDSETFTWSVHVLPDGKVSVEWNHPCEIRINVPSYEPLTRRDMQEDPDKSPVTHEIRLVPKYKHAS